MEQLPLLAVLRACAGLWNGQDAHLCRLAPGLAYLCIDRQRLQCRAWGQHASHGNRTAEQGMLMCLASFTELIHNLPASYILLHRQPARTKARDEMCSADSRLGMCRTRVRSKPPTWAERWLLDRASRLSMRRALTSATSPKVSGHS